MEKKLKKCTKCNRDSIIWKTQTIEGEKHQFCQSCHALVNKKLQAQKKQAQSEKKKKTKLAKNFSNSVLLRVADRIFSLYIRCRDSNSEGTGICCSSGRETVWGQLQNGHYISRKYMKYRFNEQNCHGQSAMDNVRLSGNMIEYRRFMIDKYGTLFENSLFEGSKEYFSYNSDFLLDIIKKYLPIVIQQLEEKNFDTSTYLKELNKYHKLYINS